MYYQFINKQKYWYDGNNITSIRNNIKPWSYGRQLFVPCVWNTVLVLVATMKVVCSKWLWNHSLEWLKRICILTFENTSCEFSPWIIRVKRACINTLWYIICVHEHMDCIFRLRRLVHCISWRSIQWKDVQLKH